MKKSALFSVTLLVISFFSAVSVRAQAFQVGTNVISAGIGLGSSIASYSYGTQSPGFSLSYEHGFWDAGPGVISLGGYVGVKDYKYNGYSYSEKWNYTIIGARGAYHFTGLDIDKLDLYAGLMLAYDNLSFSSNYAPGYSPVGSYNSDIGLSVFAGARYYFSGNLAAYAELGYGVSILSIGLAYKF